MINKHFVKMMSLSLIVSKPQIYDKILRVEARISTGQWLNIPQRLVEIIPFYCDSSGTATTLF